MKAGMAVRESCPVEPSPSPTPAGSPAGRFRTPPRSQLDRSSSPLGCSPHPHPVLPSALMSVFPSFARAVTRPAFRLPLAVAARRSMATGPAGPSGAAGDLLQATLGTDARPPSSSTGTASTSSSTAAAASSSASAASSGSAQASAALDANLYGPHDFYASSSSSSSSSPLSSFDFTDSPRPDDIDRFSSATVPYQPSAIPQTSDPLCDFWVSLTMTHGNKLKATIFLSKVLDAMLVPVCSFLLVACSVRCPC